MRYFIILTFLLVISVMCSGQSEEQIDITIREQQNQELINALNNIESNTVILSQDGFENEASIVQQQISIKSKNYLNVSQSGYNHDININVIGDRNSIQISQLNNVNNVPDLYDHPVGHIYTGKIHGNDNLINIMQTGHGNSINQETTMNVSVNLDIQQSGYNNELEIINNNIIENSLPLGIQQNGHDMKIKIENNMVVTP